MTRLEWSARALVGLDRLRLTHNLPTDTRERVEASARTLERFPRLGPELRIHEDGSELRFLIGPWPWLVIIYLSIEIEHRAIVISIEDGRAAAATISEERRR